MHSLHVIPSLFLQKTSEQEKPQRESCPPLCYQMQEQLPEQAILLATDMSHASLVNDPIPLTSLTWITKCHSYFAIKVSD